jgi:hypothetical protein
MRDPAWLWVGCGNMELDFPNPAKARSKEDIIWHCFVTCEVPFWKRLFKQVNAEPLTMKLTEQVSSILRAEPEIRLVDEP